MEQSLKKAHPSGVTVKLPAKRVTTPATVSKSSQKFTALSATKKMAPLRLVSRSPAPATQPAPARASAVRKAKDKPIQNKQAKYTQTSVKLHPNAKAPVRIFQIYYDDWHEPLLDQEFVPYDNRGVQSELFEFKVFEQLAKSARISGAKYWGALSWRFAEKTGMSGKELLDTVAAKPGFDVYYCNPFPENEAVYHNTWIQGEPSHPAFLELAKSFFEAAGLPVEQLTSIQVSGRFTAANYMVGNPAFWQAYLLFVRRALGNAERRMPANMRALLHSRIADQHSFHFGATYVPFIVERLLGTFLSTEGAHLKAFKIPLPEREKTLNVHQRLLREMKDVAHKTKSNWLAAVWMNYRSLYMTQTNGREWSQKHLRNITPTDLKFG